MLSIADLEKSPTNKKTRTAARSSAVPVFLGGEPILPELRRAHALPPSIYAWIPSSSIRASVSAFDATRRGTFFRTKRVMSVSTPNFMSAYLANCL